MTLKTYRAGHLGTFSQSGIDKKSNEEEIPVKIVNYMDVYGNKKGVLRGEQFQEVTAPKGKFPFHLLRRGDVLITPSSETSDDIGHSAVVSENLAQTAYSYHLVRFRPFKSTEIIPEFSRFAFQAQQVRAHLEKMSKGTTRKILTRNDFTTIPIIVPDLPTQRAIADFLDRETARIDTLIEKKQRLVELLGDRYERHRDQVLSASDDDLPRQSMRWLIRVGSGNFISNEEMSSELSSDRSIPVIGGNGVMAYTNRSNTPTNTLVVGRVGALCGNVHFFEHRSWVTDNALIVRLTSKAILPRYAFEILKSAKLNEKANKSAQPLITGETVKKVTVRLPPKDEQEKRVRRLSELSAKLVETTKTILSSIDRLKEYRSALITSAVTGQIDVTKWTSAGTTDRQLDAIEEEFGA